LTHSTNSSTVRRPRSSNRTTKSPSDTNSKVNTESLRKAAIRNATSDPPSPNLRKALPPIAIILTIPIPGIQNRSSPISPAEAAVPTIDSAVAFKGSLRKPNGQPATHSLWQRRPQNLPCNKYTWQHAASQNTNRLRCNEHLHIAEPT
jgi:hypothetical protein